MPVGAPGNILNPPDTHAQIRRMDLDGKNVEVVARGVRNTVGFDWNPQTKNLTFTDNGRDWVSEDIPNDELNVLSEPGKQHFGYPFCHQGNFTDRNTAGAAPARSSRRRRASSGRTPRRSDALLHGRAVPAGLQERDLHRPPRLVEQDAEARRRRGRGAPRGRRQDGEPGAVPDRLPAGQPLCRPPVDVLVARDGALLVSDDYNGAVYRISAAR